MVPRETLPPLPATERIILELLVHGGGEMYGLELVEASGGRVKRGTVYVTLARMAQRGFVESREEARPAPEVGIARRLYAASGAGQRVLSAYELAESAFNLEMGL